MKARLAVRLQDGHVPHARSLAGLQPPPWIP